MDIIWKGRNGSSGRTGRELAAEMLWASMSSGREQLAAGGCGNRFRLNQLHLTVHNADYLICNLEVRAGAGSPSLPLKDPVSLPVAQILYVSDALRCSRP